MLVKVVGSRRALESKTRALGSSQGILCLTGDLRQDLAEISVPSSAPETFRVEQIQKWDPWIVRSFMAISQGAGNSGGCALIY